MTNEEKAAKLLERNRVGAILRVFAHSPDVVEANVTSVTAAVNQLLDLKTEGRLTIARIDVLVASDPEYMDSDCGATVGILREAFSGDRYRARSVFVSEIKKGDIYCQVLNYGIVSQIEDHIAYTIVLSHQAAEYANAENVNTLLAAMYDRARAAGVAIAELEESITKGRIANTFAIWHNKSLMTVGGFDLKAAKPLHSTREKHPHVRGRKTLPHSGEETELLYPQGGVEEIVPIIRLIKTFGPCIRVVVPRGRGRWKEPNFHTDPAGYHRHHAKLATKEERQRLLAESEGATLDFLEKGIMP